MSDDTDRIAGSPYVLFDLSPERLEELNREATELHLTHIRRLPRPLVWRLQAWWALHGLQKKLGVYGYGATRFNLFKLSKTAVRLGIMTEEERERLRPLYELP